MSGADHGLGRVAVVGGGIAGLAAAVRLSRAGARVSLLEGSSQLGGLGTFFEHEGASLERFYHCVLPSDSHLLGLLRDVGIDARIDWTPTTFGYLHGGTLFPLNSPRDLLAFSPLRVADRLRVGLTGLWGRVTSARGLDDITCVEWLTRLSGADAFERFWRPMLEAKFGDRYRDVPALWFWTRFNREKGKGPERKGYPRGGYRRLIEALAGAIVEAGGRIRLDAPVAEIGLDSDGAPWLRAGDAPAERFDRVVYTAPIGLLPRVAHRESLAPHLARVDTSIDMQGVINVVLVLRRSLSPHYWVATTDGSAPFQGIVESSHIIDRRALADRRLVYLTHYLHRSDPRFATPDEVVARTYVAALKKCFPGLRRDDIEATRVFRSPFVEPLYTTGFSKRRPPECLVDGRIYLATTAQVYPAVTSWNGSVGLVERVVERVRSDAARTGPVVAPSVDSGSQQLAERAA